MNSIAASGEILQIFETGDQPVLVLCSDGYHYICKYKRPGGSANKLVNELIGSAFAKIWSIPTPIVSFIENDSIIWNNSHLSHDPEAPLFGSRKMENVVDLSDVNCNQISLTVGSLKQLLIIALFDLWIANDDRTCNNYNLLYDLKNQSIVSIDYGGIFNSGIFGMPIFQLNDSDSIMISDLYDHLKRVNRIPAIDSLENAYRKGVNACKEFIPKLLQMIPNEWNVDTVSVKNKLDELFTNEWIEQTWLNFKSIALKP